MYNSYCTKVGWKDGPSGVFWGGGGRGGLAHNLLVSFPAERAEIAVSSNRSVVNFSPPCIIPHREIKEGFANFVPVCVPRALLLCSLGSDPSVDSNLSGNSPRAVPLVFELWSPFQQMRSMCVKTL